MQNFICGKYQLSLERPLLMGIVNLTPDSFSGDGCGNNVAQAIEHARQQLVAGANILDVGAESSRPGATPTALEEELRRLTPVLREICTWGVPISVDTYKPAVMSEALALGASMINDISGVTQSEVIDILSQSACGICVMHMQGAPGTMQQAPSYDSVVSEVQAFLSAQVAECIAETGVGFMFAPNHHSAMKHAAPVRRELGVRTLFNILGPLTNPACAPYQVMGVFHPDLVGIQVRVLQRLGSERALTVFGREGLDEISISGRTLVGELKDGRITEYEVHPEDFNLPVHDPRTLQVANVEESKDMLLGALDNKIGAARDIVALNAGASIYVCGQADSLADGVEKAFEMIASGAARAKLDSFVATSRHFA